LSPRPRELKQTRLVRVSCGVTGGKDRLFGVLEELVCLRHGTLYRAPNANICMYSVTVAIWSKLLTRSAGSKLSTAKGAGRCLPLKGASSASASVPRGGLYSSRPDYLAAFWIDKMNLSAGFAGYDLEEPLIPFGRIVVNFVPDLRIHSI
jgi:hypothetical protein